MSSSDPRATDARSGAASIAAAIACVAAVGIGLSLTIPLLSIELDRMGVSKAMIGVNTAVSGAASLLVVPFVPRLAARFGLLPLLWGAVLTVPITLVGFKILYGLAWWFPLRFVLAAALGVLFVLSEYWIMAAAPRDRRGLVMGIYTTVLAAGFTAGPFILAAVGTGGWPPYLVGTALFSLATLPLLLAGKLSPVVAHGRRWRIGSFVAAAPAATLAAFVFGAIETAGFALLPVYGLAAGLTTEQGAMLVSAAALGNVLCPIPLGLLSDRIDRRLVLLGAGLAGLTGAALLPAVFGSFAGMAAVLFLWGGLTSALYTVGLAHLGSRFEAADLVGANAAFVVLYTLGVTVGPLVIGPAMDLAPPHGFAFGLAAFCALYVAVVGWRLLALRRP